MKRHTPGYSLLMTLVALAIFAVGIVSLIALLPVGQASVRRAVFNSRAATIAEREMARIRVLYGCGKTQPPAAISGRDPDGFTWEAKIAEGDIYTITLTVFRKEEGRERSATFQSGFYPVDDQENSADVTPGRR